MALKSLLSYLFMKKKEWVISAGSGRRTGVGAALSPSGIATEPALALLLGPFKPSPSLRGRILPRIGNRRTPRVPELRGAAGGMVLRPPGLWDSLAPSLALSSSGST